jgi:hypothetical protein
MFKEFRNMLQVVGCPCRHQEHCSGLLRQAAAGELHVALVIKGSSAGLFLAALAAKGYHVGGLP